MHFVKVFIIRYLFLARHERKGCLGKEIVTAFVNKINTGVQALPSFQSQEFLIAIHIHGVHLTSTLLFSSPVFSLRVCFCSLSMLIG